MKQKIGVYLNETVTILRNRKSKSLIQYEDGYEEWVDTAEITILKGYKVKTDGQREKDRIRFERHFHSEDFVKWVKGQPCLVCGVRRCDTAHVTARTLGGWQENVVSLCHNHHQEQHYLGVKTFEEKYNLDLRAEAISLYRSAKEFGIVE